MLLHGSFIIFGNKVAAFTGLFAKKVYQQINVTITFSF